MSMIRVKKFGSLYEATAPNRTGGTIGFGPMSAGELMRTLNNAGFHHTDIGDALYRADREWAGQTPRLSDEQRQGVREVFASRGIGAVRRFRAVDFDHETFLVDPKDAGAIDFSQSHSPNRDGVSDEVRQIESELESLFPDRKKILVRLQNERWLELPLEEV